MRGERAPSSVACVPRALSRFGAHYFQAPATQTKVEPLALTAAILVILFRCSSVWLYSSSTQQVNIIICILFKNIKWLKRFKWKIQFSEWCTNILKCDRTCMCKKRDKKKKKHWNWYKYNFMKSDLKLICYWKYKIQAKCQRPRYRSLKSKDIIYLVNPGSVRSGPPRELSA